MKLKNYETIFVLTPVLSNEQTKDTIAKFKNFLNEKGAEIIHEEAMGLRKLAYPIQHKTTGVYHLVEFKARPEVLSALETEYRREEKVMRFLTCALDEHGVEYNAKKRDGALAPKPETKKEVVA